MPVPSASQAMAKDGSAVALGDAAGDQADQTFVPILGAETEEGIRGQLIESVVSEGKGFFQHVRFDRLPLGVQLLELARDDARLDVVVAGKEPRAKIGRTDSAAGIDAGAENKAERIARRRLVEPGGIGQCAQTGVLAEAQHFQPLRDQSAIQPFQRHHIADGGERHEIEQAEQIGLGSIGVEALTAEYSRHRDQEQEDDARGREMTLA